MWGYLKSFLFFFVLLYSSLLISGVSIASENKIKLIERTDLQKKISVNNLTNAADGILKNYYTFSVYISETLIFCHFSNDGSDPKVICH